MHVNKLGVMLYMYTEFFSYGIISLIGKTSAGLLPTPLSATKNAAVTGPPALNSLTLEQMVLHFC